MLQQAGSSVDCTASLVQTKAPALPCKGKDMHLTKQWCTDGALSSFVVLLLLLLLVQALTDCEVIAWVVEADGCAACCVWSS